MPSALLFNIQLVLGYAAWMLCFQAYLLPWVREMAPMRALRAIAMLNAFRFFGLAFFLLARIRTEDLAV